MVEPTTLYHSTENSLYFPANTGKYSILIPKSIFTTKITMPLNRVNNLNPYSIDKGDYEHLDKT